MSVSRTKYALAETVSRCGSVAGQDTHDAHGRFQRPIGHAGKRGSDWSPLHAHTHPNRVLWTTCRNPVSSSRIVTEGKKVNRNLSMASKWPLIPPSVRCRSGSSQQIVADWPSVRLLRIRGGRLSECRPIRWTCKVVIRKC